MKIAGPDKRILTFKKLSIIQVPTNNSQQLNESGLILRGKDESFYPFILEIQYNV
jgi:hypothetical protein